MNRRPGLAVLILAMLVSTACAPAGDEPRPVQAPTPASAPAKADIPAPTPAWRYLATAVEGEARPQRTATLYNLRPDEDDPGNFAVVPTVQLVLRDDPRWGRSVYLVVWEGDFACGDPCAFRLRFDQGEQQRWAGTRSSTGTHPALFIDAEADFVAALEGSSRLELAPADGRFAPLLFDVTGFDPQRYALGR